MSAHCFIPILKVEDFTRLLMEPCIHSSFKTNLIDSRFQYLALNIDDSLKQIEKKLERQTWPNKLNFFPFNLKFIQRSCLRLFEFLFRDEKHARMHIIRIVQSLKAINQDLFITLDHLLLEQKKMRADIEMMQNQ